MTEPDVALTDYALFVECVLFAWVVARTPAAGVRLRAWLVVFFAATAFAALFGGTMHGFFSGADDRLGAVLWGLSLLAIGTAALAGLATGAYLVLADERARRLVRLGCGLLAAYAAVVVFVNGAFWVAIAAYLPAAVFMLAAFGRMAVRTRQRSGGLVVAGLTLTFVAAAIQQLRFSVHPVYFSHNALYHVIQAAALALMFAGCRRLLPRLGGVHAEIDAT
jgi:hypothetical protein